MCASEWTHGARVRADFSPSAHFFGYDEKLVRCVRVERVSPLGMPA
ncbi:hypothetical protein FHT78_002797 [Rhizobium sp. BK196]|nr:hypothetical protein [Rhizobium sp. BK196]MBB3460066.1 hypothetical protein [Rhizobium sp. BK377]